MAFDRPAATIYLQNKYAALATLAGQTVTTDSADGYGPAIDEALLTYGTTYTDILTPTVADADVLGVRALLRYYALLHFEQRLVTEVSVVVSGASASYSEQLSVALTQVRSLLAEAAKQVAAYGYVVDGAGGTWSSGFFNLDFLEPSGSF